MSNKVNVSLGPVEVRATGMQRGAVGEIASGDSVGTVVMKVATGGDNRYALVTLYGGTYFNISAGLLVKVYPAGTVVTLEVD